MDISEESCSRNLHSRDLLEINPRQILITSRKLVLFHSFELENHNEDRRSFHAVQSFWREGL